MGATRRQMLAQGAAAARAPDAAARRQPDDPLRALDGRHRRPDRRRRPRRGRDERAVHEPRARAPRRCRDRDHGDGARPGRPRRSPSAPTRQAAISTTPASGGCDCVARRRRRIAATVAVAKLSRRRGVYPDTFGADERAAPLQDWVLATIQSVLDYVQNPDSWVFAITEPTGNNILKHVLLPIQNFLVEAPWFTTLAGLALIALVVSGRRAGADDARDARPDRRPRGLGARDGHALAGARRDALRRHHRGRPRRLRGGEQDGLEDPAPDQRRAADAAAARLHHPVRLPDARLDRARASSPASSTRSRSSSGSSSAASTTSRRRRSRRPALSAPPACRC